MIRVRIVPGRRVLQGQVDVTVYVSNGLATVVFDGKTFTMSERLLDDPDAITSFVQAVREGMMD